MTELTTTTASTDIAVPGLQSALGYAELAAASNTARAYSSDWRAFQAYCAANGLDSLPALPATVAAYASDMADKGRKASTINRHLTTLRVRHTDAGFADPTKDPRVKMVLKGIRRAIGSRPTRKAPLLTETVVAMLSHLDLTTLAGMRDKALLLIGFAGAFRRSELVAIRVEDLAFSKDGVVIVLPFSKTDQDGEGQEVSIAYGQSPATCPVRALNDWLLAADITEGDVFRRLHKGESLGAEGLNDRYVANLVKRLAQACGLDPEIFSGHSARAGLATQAIINGADERTVMRQTRHKSLEVFMTYVRDARRWEGNASSALGL